MRSHVKNGLYYFLMLQLHVFAALGVYLVLSLLLSFFVKSWAWLWTVEAICGLGVELFLAFFFAKRQIGKRTSYKEILIPFALALVLHFLVACLNTFYIYTAGVASSTASLLWESLLRGEPAVMQDVAFYRRLLPFLCVEALLLLATYLGCRWGKRAEK